MVAEHAGGDDSSPWRTQKGTGAPRQGKRNAVQPHDQEDRMGGKHCLQRVGDSKMVARPHRQRQTH